MQKLVRPVSKYTLGTKTVGFLQRRNVVSQGIQLPLPRGVYLR